MMLTSKAIRAKKIMELSSKKFKRRYEPCINCEECVFDCGELCGLTEKLKIGPVIGCNAGYKKKGVIKMWGILFIVLAVAFVIMEIGMFKYLVEIYTVENNVEKGFALINTKQWECE